MWLHLCYSVGMPNKRQSDKRMIRAWITAELYEMFRKRASQLGTTMSELLTLYIIQQTKNITLTPEDYERIAREQRSREGSGKKESDD